MSCLNRSIGGSLIRALYHTASTRRSDSRTSALDPDLAKIVAAWPSLPEPIRRAVLALIRD
jgi:hypothetical protein